jgi:hypothetical protein
MSQVVKLLIERYLVEAADLDKADVGIELELAIRRDFFKPGIFDDFEEFLDDHGFSYDYDGSISVLYGKENFYLPIELSSVALKWSELRQNLDRVLAFLRHEDVVEITPDFKFRPLKPIFRGFDKVRTAGGKLLKLPRAITPKNFSAGTHLHFDHQWFDSAEHVLNFVATFNRFQHKLPDLLPKQRYNFDQRKNEYAKLTPHPLMRAAHGSHLNHLTVLGLRQRDRYRALNFVPVEKRGDVEFRFMHATLSLNVIEGWVRTIAELIELAKSGTGAWRDKTAAQFDQYFQQNNPELADFLAKQRQKSEKSRPFDSKTKGELSKAAAKLQSIANKLSITPYDYFYYHPTGA